MKLDSALHLGFLLFFAAHVDAQTFTVSNALGDAETGSSAGSLQPAVVGSSHGLPSWGKTADGSSLTIAFNDTNKFRLLPNSLAQVTTGDGDSSSAWHRVVNLKIGKASLSHDSSGSPSVKLECVTPTAVCGAVGTEFDVDATAGTYSVSSGSISVESSREDNLSLPHVSGGTVSLQPGKENTFSRGDFSGTVRLDGSTMRASDASFTVAKALGSSGETAVHISSGTLGGHGPGNYLINGGGMVPVTSDKESLQAEYIEAANEEGALGVRNAALHASGRGGVDSELASAAAHATALRAHLFERETVRNTVKDINSAIRDSALRGGLGR